MPTGKTRKPSKPLVVGPALPNIPWEDRPAGCSDVVWRYSGNPIIPRDSIPTANSTFNSAVVPFKGKFAGVFRIDDLSMTSRLHVGFSADGINWRISPRPIQGLEAVPGVPFRGGYDPRVCRLGDRYYVTWCNGYFGPTIGVAWTRDFRKFHQEENAFLQFNRNGVLFPRKIGGRYAMLSRPGGPGHNPYGNIFFSESPDMTYWGRHRLVMRTADAGGWGNLKIGPGPTPIETREGWLLIYHGVIQTCSGFVYRAGAALLDLEEPWKVRACGQHYILAPRELYECVGDVPNVVFPCAALVDAPSGRLAIYYGCADSVVGLAFAHAGEIVDFIMKHRS
jgi:beta-1,4-mannooligosaccharide/beta-1,4-mannosyl-N-acetylglucosamine phosphorylase